jgi:hypothetical protein
MNARLWSAGGDAAMALEPQKSCQRWTRTRVRRSAGGMANISP